MADREPYTPSTVEHLRRLVLRGCADPGEGGCIGGLCPSCDAKAKLEATGQLYDERRRPSWVFAEK